MKHRSLDNLKRKAAGRPEGYLADVRAHAQEWNEAEGWYTLADDDFAALRLKWTSISNRPNRRQVTTRPAATTHRSDCGDRYKAELHVRFGGAPCGACEAERKRMNTMTVAECIADRENIIGGTIARAKSHPNWWTRIKAKAADAVAPDATRRVIGEAFDAAMRAAGDAPHRA